MPLEIEFRNVLPSAALSAAVRKRALRLDQLGEAFVGCHVTIESKPQDGGDGMLQSVEIRLTLAGMTLTAGCSRHASLDPTIAVHDAFDALQRQLLDRTGSDTREPEWNAGWMMPILGA